ncbi:hypothetical protein B0T16DRAFT_338954 [Cercophora newfieldiana]|uniref:Heterokaryon incompatibility domain-containing protein n=1 Tax=Cercophora newfieldiana TaxID=92897 RepID=A0AA40CIK6_9PEZI|nr:hypothetical protein B0T16DRAFT_338954 [Cercophora newfieldiana]
MAIYTPLNEQKKEIRLLSLNSGSGSDPIYCSLCIVSLHDRPKYEALSYVWGPPEPSHLIRLDGQPFRVTSNLYAALKRLRLPHSRRTLWVDA